MKIRILTLALFIIFIAPSTIQSQEKSGAAKGWELVWEDDFNGTALDTSKWNVLMREQSKHGDRNWPMEYMMLEAVAAGKESLIPEERAWYSEIDIMEFPGHEPDIQYGTLHYYTFDGQKKTSS